MEIDCRNLSQWERGPASKGATCLAPVTDAEWMPWSDAPPHGVTGGNFHFKMSENSKFSARSTCDQASLPSLT